MEQPIDDVVLSRLGSPLLNYFVHPFIPPPLCFGGLGCLGRKHGLERPFLDPGYFRIVKSEQESVQHPSRERSSELDCQVTSSIFDEPIDQLRHEVSNACFIRRNSARSQIWIQ